MQACTCTLQFSAREEMVSAEECLRSSNGAEYKGKKATTKSGKTCVKWNKMGEPMKHNYCRNPDGEPKPYCWIDGGSDHEFCDIPMCGEGILCFVNNYMYPVM